MSFSIDNWPLKLAGVIMLASLPFLWWAADRADQALHLELAATTMLLVVATWGLVILSEGKSDIDAIRRRGARIAALMAMIYIWGSLAIFVSYYLTGLSWYHAYQYAMYLAIPGVFTLNVARRNAIQTEPQQVVWNKSRGSYLTVIQAIVMVASVLYLCVWSGKFLSSGHDWAAMSILTSGAIALAVTSILSLATS